LMHDDSRRRQLERIATSSAQVPVIDVGLHHGHLSFG
jgi:hypothetical protein